MKSILYRLWTNPVLCSAVGVAAFTYLATETAGIYAVFCGLGAAVFAITGRELVVPTAKLDS